MQINRYHMTPTSASIYSIYGSSFYCDCNDVEKLFFEDFTKINEIRQAKCLPRVIRVYQSNIIFHFSLLSEENGGFAMAYQRLHDLVMFVHFIAVLTPANRSQS